jgi:drug/metabolite transporter (DMT)-like permease
VRWNLSIAALAGSWGFISVLVDAVDLGAGPLVFWRLAIAATTVALLLAALRQASSLRLPRLRLATAATGLGLAAHWLLFFQTIKLASVAVALVLVYTGPVLLALLAPLYLPEVRSRVALGALVPAVAGIALIALVGGEADRPRPLAILCGLGAAATYAMLVIAFKRLAAELPVPALNLWTAVVAAVALSPALVLAGDAMPNGVDVFYVVLLGAGFTGVSWLLYLWLLRRDALAAAPRHGAARRRRLLPRGRVGGAARVGSPRSEAGLAGARGRRAHRRRRRGRRPPRAHGAAASRGGLTR